MGQCQFFVDSGAMQTRFGKFKYIFHYWIVCAYMIKILDFTLLLFYCLFIYWLSDQPSLPAPMWFEHQDKLYHAGAYSIMGLLAWRSFRHVVSSPIILALLSIAFCSLYGLSDEWHQSFVA